jgi:hypothetical protein
MDIPLNYFIDKQDINKYSNPKIVQQKAKEYGIPIVFSPRKNKKYVIMNPDTNKYIHFGQMGYEDLTKHEDKERAKRFKLRNHRWANAPKYSASWLSYHILWS